MFALGIMKKYLNSSYMTIPSPFNQVIAQVAQLGRINPAANPA
jgi:hypothetical protein